MIVISLSYVGIICIICMLVWLWNNSDKQKSVWDFLSLGCLTCFVIFVFVVSVPNINFLVYWDWI
jgi:hypothetical protein